MDGIVKRTDAALRYIFPRIKCGAGLLRRRQSTTYFSRLARLTCGSFTTPSPIA